MFGSLLQVFQPVSPQRAPLQRFHSSLAKVLPFSVLDHRLNVLSGKINFSFVIAARKQSYRKVMFSQMSVSHYVHKVLMYPGGGVEITYPQNTLLPEIPTPRIYTHRDTIPEGRHIPWDTLTPRDTLLPGIPYPLLTSSGGHCKTYVWQAGGTHPTGMLSWLKCQQRAKLKSAYMMIT